VTETHATEPLGDPDVSPALRRWTYRAIRPVAITLSVLHVIYIGLGEIFLDEATRVDGLVEKALQSHSTT